MPLLRMIIHAAEGGPSILFRRFRSIEIFDQNLFHYKDPILKTLPAIVSWVPWLYGDKCPYARRTNFAISQKFGPYCSPIICGFCDSGHKLKGAIGGSRSF